MRRPLIFHRNFLVLGSLFCCQSFALADNRPAAGKGAASAVPALAARQGAAPRTINWDALVLAGWDPYKEMKADNMQSMRDGDPRAMAMLKKLREVWDNAPVNPALEGQVVRIPGYVVPLEDSKDGITEFLLVPYFGACIHTPPPPSNQIIHVLPRSPAKGLRQMDTVWITGKLNTVMTESYMGTSSWRMEADAVAPYVEGAAAPATGQKR